jgi:hypothetical protein
LPGNGCQQCGFLSSLVTPSQHHKAAAPTHSQPNKFRVRVTLGLVVYSHSVHLDAKPLVAHDQSFFLQLNPYGNFLSDERMGLSLMDMLGLFKVYNSMYSMILKIICFTILYKSSVSPGFAEQIMSILFSLSYNGGIVT